MTGSWKKFLNRSIGTFAFVILVCLTLFLLWHTKQLEKQLAEIKISKSWPNTIDVNKLLHHKLSESEQRSARLIDTRTDFIMAFFFRIGDCPSCVDEIHDLMMLHSLDEIDLVVVVGESNLDEASQLQRSHGCRVLLDQDDALFRELQFPVTPYKMLISKKKAEIILHAGPRSRPEDTEIFIQEAVSRIVNNGKE